jgi:cation transport protein ChaC
VLGAMVGGRDLWVFGYGSLMWDPAFLFAEIRRATLAGYRRRFTLRLTIGRGSLGYPGLMLSLETGEGACEGLAFRIDATHADAESTILWRREMIRGAYLPVLLPVHTPQGPVTALVFAVNAAHPEHVGELPLAETAVCIARGAGLLGTNRGYLEQLAAQLQALAIDDAYVSKLLQQVRAVSEA